MQDFRNLLVWQKAHELTLLVYRETRAFPTDERFGLTSQMRRAAVSIGSNLAEGSGRGSDRDFSRFVQLAMGSASELEYQVLLAHDLELWSGEVRDRMHERVAEVKRMLAALIRKLNAVAVAVSADS